VFKEPVAEPFINLISIVYFSLGFFHAGTKTWTHLALACGQSIMGYFGETNILFIIDSYGQHPKYLAHSSRCSVFYASFVKMGYPSRL